MKRLGWVCGIVGACGLLGVSACTTKASTAAAPLETPSAVVAGSTLVDCGRGQRALLKQANGVTQVLCVTGEATSGTLFDSDGLQPIPVAARPPAAVQGAPAAAQPAAYEPRPATRRVATRGRTWKKSAAIIGGSTAAGAGVGAIMGGGSGAKKGAVVGLLGGVVYDVATRDR